jgi:hypothetical protein
MWSQRQPRLGNRAKWIHSKSYHPVSSTCFSVLTSRPCLALESSFFLLVSPLQTLHNFILSPAVLHAPPNPFSVILPPYYNLDKSTKDKSPYYTLFCINLLHFSQTTNSSLCTPFSNTLGQSIYRLCTTKCICWMIYWWEARAQYD